MKYVNTFGGFLCLFGRWFIQTSDSSEIFGDADVDDKDTDDGDVEDVDVDPPEEFNDITTGDDETPETDEFWRFDAHCVDSFVDDFEDKTTEEIEVAFSIPIEEWLEIP